MSHLLRGSKVTERDVTVICQDDDVKTTVEADLLQAVHQLTHDPVNVLDGQNQLRTQNNSSQMDSTNHNRDQRELFCGKHS